MSASATSCAYCGKQGVSLKRCKRCMAAFYCGPECQKAGWQQHKKACQPVLERLKVLEGVLTAAGGTLPPLNQLREASAAQNWRGVLKLEGRMEELMEGAEDTTCDFVLRSFARAHQLAHGSNSDPKHCHSIISIGQRRVELLGKMQRFRDQADAICSIGDSLIAFKKSKEGGSYYQRARDLGAQHGFFSIECRACVGLGNLAIEEGRHEEGQALLRNAVAAAPLNEARTLQERRDSSLNL